MTSLPFQVGPYEQIRSYDRPQVLIEMALDNELTVPGVVEALFDPDRLSAKERHGYIDELKQKVGGGAIGEAFVELATNPLVWALFITGPAGATALERAGKGILSVAPKYSAYVVKHVPFLQALGFGTAYHTFQGTEVVPAMMQMTKALQKMTVEADAGLSPLVERVMLKNGLKKGLYPEQYVKGSEAYEKAREINKAIAASLDNWDKATTEFVPVWKKKQGLIVKQVERPALIAGNMDDVLRKYDGAFELKEAYKQVMRDRYKALMLKADGSVDKDKALRIFRGVTHQVTHGGIGPSVETGASVISNLMSPKIQRAIEAGKLTEDQWLKWIDETVAAPLAGGRDYLPRNQWVVKGAKFDDAQLLAWQRSQGFAATKSVTPRQVFSNLIDPEDMQYAERWGLTPEGYRKLDQSLKVEEQYRGTAAGVSMRTLESQKAIEKYLKGSAQTFALYVDEPGKALKLTRGEVEAAKRQAFGTALDEFRATKDLRGGESVADVLQESYVLLNGGKMGAGRKTFAQDMLQNVYLPRILGRVGVQHAGMYAALQQTKLFTKAFAEGKVGAAISKGSNYGKGVIDRLREWSDTDLGPGEAKSMAGWLARLFYVSHLGGNISSVLMNMSQPWLLGAVRLSTPAMLKGYAEAFKELGQYTALRARQGYKPLTDAEKREVIHKTFKWANVDGEDLIGISPNVFETLDNVSQQFSSLGRASRRQSYVFDYPMKLFEKAEWMNRSVVAHATEAMYRKAGRNIAVGSDDHVRLLGDVKQLVGETQFGGDILNTPAVFLGAGFVGRAGDNPLFRQFLNFPLRSLTGTFAVGPRFGESRRRLGWGYETSTAGGAFIHDTARMLGISAVIYEAGKALLGADLSRGLFTSSVTEVVGGNRVFQGTNDWIPMPPIVSIPADMVRGALGGDYALLQRTLPRLLPGGVAISRAMGVLPDLPNYDLVGGLPGALQRNYVDWGAATLDGQVPMFKGDGTLVGYFKGPELILRGMGADLGRFQEAGDLDNYLVKIGEETKRYRQDAMAAYFANNPSKAQSIRNEYAKRFGIPLTISQDQFKRAIRNREVPRTERILDSIPAEARPAYIAMVARSQRQRTGLSPEQLESAQTASQRLPRPANVTLDPATIEALRQAIQEKETQQAFGSFGSSFTDFED